MRSRIPVSLSAADLERERQNLERGSLVAAGASGVAIGAFCDVELALPSGERLTLPARAVLATGAGTVLAFDEEVEAPSSVQERLRGLSVVEQLRVAREGTLTERVVLERIYGKTVWEALLRNSHLTVPEVSRLARMGTMPRPLLELIAGNPSWLQAPQVRRGLLSNPRLSAEMVQRVLAALPREELKAVPQNTAYPAGVRMAAKAMLRR